MLGGAVTISLTNAPVTLSVPAGFVATPSAGPTQSQNAFLNFTGTLSADCAVTFPMPGFYIVNNRCVVGAFVVFLASAAPGNTICAPPGECVEVFCDGINMWYVGLDRVGAYMDLGTSVVPRWISACTVPPYLNCDGTAFSGATYPALSALLGGTTLPDMRGRFRAALNQGTGRIDAAGIDGDLILSSGSADTYTITQANLPAVNFPVSGLSTLSGVATWNNQTAVVGGGGGSPFAQQSSAFKTSSNYTPTGGTAASGGSGAAIPMVPPMQIGGLTLIRAG